jgi:hypothetical protein
MRAFSMLGLETTPQLPLEVVDRMMGQFFSSTLQFMLG